MSYYAEVVMLSSVVKCVKWLFIYKSIIKWRMGEKPPTEFDWLATVLKSKVG